MDAHRGGADEGGHVGRYAPVFQVLQVFAQRGPGNVEADVALVFQHLGLHGVVQRAHGTAFAHHLEGHALADVALRPAVLDQRLGGPAQHVDEAGRDGQAPGVDGLSGAAVQIADCDDAVAPDRHVGPEGRAAVAVVNRPVHHHEVVNR